MFNDEHRAAFDNIKRSLFIMRFKVQSDKYFSLESSLCGLYPKKGDVYHYVYVCMQISTYEAEGGGSKRFGV